MSATLPLPTDQQPAYRDRKRLMWLLSVIGPAGVTIGPVALPAGRHLGGLVFRGLRVLLRCHPSAGLAAG
jgi:hypothetical protein